MSPYHSIVVLTGAGVSAESGLRTFRDAGGLWEGYRVADVATPQAFARDPEAVQRFYNERRRQLLDSGVRPNAAHEALAELERKFPGEFLLVTQNIDNLHERTGSRRMIHMHGELLKARCVRSGKTWPVEKEISVSDRCACCAPPAPLRPHVVWFGEEPLGLDTIFRALHGCDLFVSVGTSGSVFPAAGFVMEARSRGAHTVELNMEPSTVEAVFVEKSYGSAGTVVPAFVRKLLGRGD